MRFLTIALIVSGVVVCVLAGIYLIFLCYLISIFAISKKDKPVIHLVIISNSFLKYALTKYLRRNTSRAEMAPTYGWRSRTFRQFADPFDPKREKPWRWTSIWYIRKICLWLLEGQDDPEKRSKCFKHLHIKFYQFSFPWCLCLLYLINFISSKFRQNMFQWNAKKLLAKRVFAIPKLY